MVGSFFWSILWDIIAKHVPCEEDSLTASATFWMPFNFLYVLYLLIMFDCLSSSGLFTAVSLQLEQSKYSLNICSMVMLTWTKTGMSGKKASMGKRRN